MPDNLPTIEASRDRTWFRSTGRSYRVRDASLVETAAFRAVSTVPMSGHLRTIVRREDGKTVTFAFAEPVALDDFSDDELAGNFDAELSGKRDA